MEIGRKKKSCELYPNVTRIYISFLIFSILRNFPFIRKSAVNIAVICCKFPLFCPVSETKRKGVRVGRIGGEFAYVNRGNIKPLIVISLESVLVAHIAHESRPSQQRLGESDATTVND